MNMYVFTRNNNKKVQELWWLGLPPGVRGQVWIRAIGNELNISKGTCTSAHSQRVYV